MHVYAPIYNTCPFGFYTQRLKHEITHTHRVCVCVCIYACADDESMLRDTNSTSCMYLLYLCLFVCRKHDVSKNKICAGAWGRPHVL